MRPADWKQNEKHLARRAALKELNGTRATLDASASILCYFSLLSKRMCNSPEVYSAIHLGSGGNAWEDLQQHLYTLGAMGGVDGSLWTLRYE